MDESEPHVMAHVYGLFEHWTVPYEADGEDLISLHLDFTEAEKCMTKARQANLHVDPEDFEVRVLPVYA